jgi:hypothetical protein
VARTNRCSSGKGAHAKDEKMELMNLDFLRFYMPRTKEKFVDSSRHLGVVKKAKSAIIEFYTIRPLKKRKPPHSASKKVDKPQQQIIYELFAKMRTDVLSNEREFGSNLIKECPTRLVTKLKLESVESRMVDTQEYTSDKILSSLRQCIMERESISTKDMTEHLCLCRQQMLRRRRCLSRNL